MTYYPFTPDDRGTWTVPLQGISVNGKLISTSGGGSNTNHSTNVSASATTSASKNAGVNAAVFHSTRTRGIVVPPRVAPQILESIPGAVFDDHYRLPTIQCDNLRNLDVRLIIGGDEYLMNSRDLLLYQTNSSKCIIDISSSSGS